MTSSWDHGGKCSTVIEMTIMAMVPMMVIMTTMVMMVNGHEGEEEYIEDDGSGSGHDLLVGWERENSMSWPSCKVHLQMRIHPTSFDLQSWNRQYVGTRARKKNKLCGDSNNSHKISGIMLNLIFVVAIYKLVCTKINKV